MHLNESKAMIETRNEEQTARAGAAGGTEFGAYATAQAGYSFGDVQRARVALGAPVASSADVSGAHAALTLGLARLRAEF